VVVDDGPQVLAALGLVETPAAPRAPGG
jgi:hypothetical protein